MTQVTLPPATRVAYQGNPPADMDLVVTALVAMQATSWVYPSGDTSGATDAANIMAVYAALGATGGVVWLAPGVFYVETGTVVIDTPQVKIKGVLRWASKIFAVGTGGCIRMYDSVYGGSGWGAGVEDVVIDGTHATAPATGLHLGDMEQAELNVAVQNFTGGSCYGVLLDNTIWWTEKIHGTIFARNCDTHVGFTVSGATTSTNSFGYLDLTCYLYVQPGQNGVIIENGATPYHGRLAIKGDCQGAASGSAPPLLQITGQLPAGHSPSGWYSQIYGCELDVQVELVAGSAVPMQTINFGTAGSNAIFGCHGVLSFQGGPWTGSNANIPGAANTLWFQGPILGDANLAPNNVWRLPTVSGALLLGESFFSGANGNLFTNSGDFFSATLSANITINLVPSGNTPVAAAPQRKTIIIKQAASGGPYTVTWPKPGSPSTSAPAVYWAGGTAPTMSAGASAIDKYTLDTIDGIHWYGTAAQALS